MQPWTLSVQMSAAVHSPSGCSISATMHLELKACTTGTSETGAFSRCRYATPPYFDAMSSLGGAAPCFVANETNPCPAGCDAALMGLAALGCCYQSLYNNSAYLQGIVSAGSLTQEQYQALQGLGNPLLWAACQVMPLAMQCTSEGIAFPTSFAATTSVYPCAMIFLLVIALCIMLSV